MEALIPDLLEAEDGGTLPVPPVDKQACALLGPTALVVQALMAVLVLTSLLIKRFRENPRRQWSVWLGDVSKQIIGQGFLHSSNVLISTLFQTHHLQNACTAYFLSIFVDCTIGVVIIYANLRLFSWILIDKLHLVGFKSGRYYYYDKAAHSQSQQDGHGRASFDSSSAQTPASASRADDAADAGYYDTDLHQHDEEDPKLPEHSHNLGQRSPFQIIWWLRQLLVYLLVLAIMKSIILAFFWIPLIFDFGDWLLSWMKEDVKIVFVLMIFPLLMNAFQFLIIDTILKSSAPKSGDAAQETIADIDDSSRRNSRDENRRREGRGLGSGDDEENQAFLSANRYDQDATDEQVNALLPAYEQSSPTNASRPTGNRHGSSTANVVTGKTFGGDALHDDSTATAVKTFDDDAGSPLYPPTVKAIPGAPKAFAHKKRDSFSFSASSHDDGNEEDQGWGGRRSSLDEKAAGTLYSGSAEKAPLGRIDLQLQTDEGARAAPQTTSLKLPVTDARSRSTGMLRTGSEQSTKSEQSGAGWDWLDEDEQEAQRVGAL